MPVISLTDDELAYIRVEIYYDADDPEFDCEEDREDMIERLKEKLAKAAEGKPPPKPKPKVDAIWAALKDAARG